MASGAGRPFWKAVGSGNDFVFLDARAADHAPDPLETPETIAALCAPHVGVGADGVVFVGAPVEPDTALAIRYYNSDGSRASFCGNASLCATQMAVELGLAARHVTFGLTTDAGRLSVCAGDGTRAAIELAAPGDVLTSTGDLPIVGEERIGYAVAGVPHVVVLVADAREVAVDARGAALRAATLARPAGANVNFVARATGADAEHAPWVVRTFERGVEGETLACGSGSVATATLLAAWGLVEPGSPVAMRTASGQVLTVTARGGDRVELAGEGRIVYEGRLRNVR
jgi:diaminopimelate epimerase